MVVAPLKLDKIHDLTAGERQALEKLPALVKSGALWACEVAGGLRGLPLRPGGCGGWPIAYMLPDRMAIHAFLSV
jgi:hypothetical protein